jgi:hypothetical protein
VFLFTMFEMYSTHEYAGSRHTIEIRNPEIEIRYKKGDQKMTFSYINHFIIHNFEKKFILWEVFFISFFHNFNIFSIVQFFFIPLFTT